MNAIRLILLSCALSFGCSYMSMPTDFANVAAGTRANLKANFSEAENKFNPCADSVAQVRARLSNYTTNLTITSLEHLRLRVDGDATATGLFLVEGSAGDSLFRVSESLDARLFGHVAIDSNLTVRKVTAADSLIGPSLTLSGLTASRLVASNAGKTAASVSDLTSWIAGTANQITSTSDGDGSLTLSLPSAVTLPGSASVTTTLGVTGLQTNAADIAMSAGDAFVRGTTSDGSDSHRSILSGGGASSTSNTRGSSVITKGNEYASQPGGIDLVLGDVTGSAVRVIGAGAVVDSFSAGGGLYVGGNLSITRSASGASVNADVENSSNTASSNARLHAQVAGTSAGDPFTHYSISGTQEWATGPDNSDGDAYVITPGATPGVTTNGLRISTAGAVTVPGTLEVTGTVTADSIISSKFYTEATFTLTGTGFTSSPTGTARYVRVGKMVTLYIPSIQATSNAATLTYTGVPAAIRPARIQTVPVEALVDNSSNFCSGYIDVETGGTLTVARRTSATATNPSGFTTSNTKGISGATITYTLQ